MNEVIAIYSKGTTKDAYGTLQDTRTLVTTVYARVRPLSGAERDRGDQIEAQANYRFTIHQRSDLDEANVIVWRSNDYNISFIADNGPYERYMYIDAARGVAQ